MAFCKSNVFGIACSLCRIMFVYALKLNIYDLTYHFEEYIYKSAIALWGRQTKSNDIWQHGNFDIANRAWISNCIHVEQWVQLLMYASAQRRFKLKWGYGWVIIHSTRYSEYGYLSMRKSQLIYVSKRDPWRLQTCPDHNKMSNSDTPGCKKKRLCSPNNSHELLFITLYLNISCVLPQLSRHSPLLLHL